MSIYHFVAEKMTRSQLEDVAQGLEDDGLGLVLAGGMDPVFAGFAMLIVECEAWPVVQIVARLHEANGGAYATGDLITDEQAEAFL